MVRSLTFVPAMLLAASVVSAQAPAEPATPATPAPRAQEPATPATPAKPAEPSASSAGKITYTGCVKPGTTAGSFVLENVEIGGAGSSASAAKPGQSTVGTSGGMKTFTLQTKPGTDLKPHTNHKVEIVGSVAAARPSAGAAGADPGAAASAGAPRQELSVESVKMVSATCP